MIELVHRSGLPKSVWCSGEAIEDPSDTFYDGIWFMQLDEVIRVGN